MQLLLVGVVLATVTAPRFSKNPRLTTAPDVARPPRNYDVVVRKLQRGPLGHIVPMSSLTFDRIDSLATGFIGVARSF